LILYVTMVTPTHIGSYESHILDELWFLKPSSIKGIVKWWARAIIGGILLDMGMLNIEIIERFLYQIGLGSKLGPSRVIIRTFTLKQPDINSKDINVYHRLELLSIGRRENKEAKVREYMIDGEFEIILINDNSLVDRITMLSLMLSGIGKGSRKVLGSIDITRVVNFKITEQTLGDFIEKTYDEIKEFIQSNLKPKITKTKLELPPFPTLNKRTAQIGIIRNCDPVKLHNFVLKSRRKISAEDSWILGLPRGRETGFITNDNIRRASSVIFTYHNRLPFKGMEKIGIITIFQSNDFPDKIIHKGQKHKEHEIKIDNQAIKGAVKNIIKDLNNTFRVEWIWP